MDHLEQDVLSCIINSCTPGGSFNHELNSEKYRSQVLLFLKAIILNVLLAKPNGILCISCCTKDQYRSQYMCSPQNSMH
jgi:hypothetical protein